MASAKRERQRANRVRGSGTVLVEPFTTPAPKPPSLWSRLRARWATLVLTRFG
jgi:hypothetical protein